MPWNTSSQKKSSNTLSGRHIIPLLRTGLSFNLTTSLTMLLIGFIFADKLTSLLTSRPEMVQLVRITLVLVLIQPLATVAGCTLLGFGNMKDYAIIDVARQLVRTVVSPLLIVLGFSVLGAVAGYVIASTVGFIISLTLVYRHYRQVKRLSLNPATASGREVLASMIAYGLPLYLSNTLSGFTATLRGVILAYFTTNFLIGNFNTAMNFTVLITLISSPIATALFPAFSKLESNGGEAKTMFTYSVKYTSALIIPAAVFISTMSRDLIFLLYGEGYSHAPLYLTLYTVNFLFAGIGLTVLGSFFSGVGDSKVNLKATLLYVCLFIPSAIALTSVLQVEGLLIAIIAATAASTLYSLLVANRRYHLRIDLKSSAKIYLAAFLAATPTTLLAQYPPLPRIANLTLSAILYFTVYLTAVLLLRILTREDLKTLTLIFDKVAVLRPIVQIISSYENKIMALLT